MGNKKAIIFGVTGQDGAYLSRLLLSKGYIVHGVKRRGSTLNTQRIDDIYFDPLIKKNKFFLHYGDVTDSINVFNIIKKIKPNEVYNLAAQSHVAVSFDIPEYTSNADALGTLRILEAIVKINKNIKFYQAGSSEMFGKVVETPQTEKTPFYPRSTYGISKVAGFDLTRNYREAYKLFCCSGILFNHESPRRGFEFVTRKITHGVARIKYGLQKDLKLGNMDAKRDWGHAEDYVRAMWLMLNKRTPEDFVISYGKQYSVRDFAKLAFKIVNLDYRKFIKIDKSLKRPADVQNLLGNCSKAKKILKWKPKYNFEGLVNDMVKADLEFVKKYGY